MAASSYRFRTSLAGFNKGDVTAYIEKTATQHRSELLERESKIAELQEEIRALTQQMNLLMMAMPTPSPSPVPEENAEAEPEASPVTAEENIEEAAVEAGVEAETKAAEAVVEENAEETKEVSESADKAEAESEEIEQEEESSPAAVEEEVPADTEELQSAPETENTTDLAELVSLELQAYRRAEAAERNANTRARVVYQELEGLCDDALENFKAADEAMKQTIETISAKAADLEKAYAEFTSALNASREKIAFIDKQYPTSDKK